MEGSVYAERPRQKTANSLEHNRDEPSKKLNLLSKFENFLPSRASPPPSLCKSHLGRDLPFSWRTRQERPAELGQLGDDQQSTESSLPQSTASTYHTATFTSIIYHTMNQQPSAKRHPTGSTIGHQTRPPSTTSSAMQPCCQPPDSHRASQSNCLVELKAQQANHSILPSTGSTTGPQTRPLPTTAPAAQPHCQPPDSHKASQAKRPSGAN